MGLAQMESCNRHTRRERETTAMNDLWVSKAVAMPIPHEGFMSQQAGSQTNDPCKMRPHFVALLF